MHPAWFHIENEAEIPSPALLFYRSRIEHNLKLMIQIAGGDPQRLRPHVKTHKCAEIIAWQVHLGITSFKASTIAEAEMCAAAGAKDVLLAMPCVGPNAHRLAELALKFPHTAFSSIADAEDSIRFLASAAQQHRVTLGAYIEIDCGMARTGLPPGDEAAYLARVMKETPMLQFRGIHAYDGHIHDESIDVRRERCEAAFESVHQFRCRLQGEGLIVKELIAGGSPTFGVHAKHADRTLSPGTTVLWDFGQAAENSDQDYAHAAILLARVISRPTPDRICIDLGHKAVAAEMPQPRVRWFTLEDAEVVLQNEEHLVLKSDRAAHYPVGTVVYGIPRHICPTVALQSEVVCVSNGKAVENWPVVARARKITI
ncbi:MAG: D-TA family PLP-dependent enzyme [bacterium]